MERLPASYGTSFVNLTMMMNIQLQKIGPTYDPQSSEFILWSPLRRKVELLLGYPDEAAYPMQKDEKGYWKTSLQTPVGTKYRFRLDGETVSPDPASFCQPMGVHGPSVLVDRSSFPWTDYAWKGIPLSNMIIYELHTGCFSGSQDFEGVRDRLDYLAELGINTIEIMPLAQFPGDRNWGYDGVYPFAVQHSYGGYTEFQRLVNAAHEKGIAVIVDVVYNHLGPEGNYLHACGPYFTDKYNTPWGHPLNFDDAWSDGVRNYFLQNARMWLEDYHVDGLRIDAVHALRDFSAYHIVQQLKDLALDIGNRTDRKKVLVAEIDLNDPRYINPREKGGYGLDGQWVDEFHHSLRALLTGDSNAYYADFGDIKDLEKAFRNTYVYNGTWSAHRKRTFGAPVENNPYSQFVVFGQNHDQIGNRPLGDRLSTILSPEQLKLSAATVLLSPYIPLLFMGEEYGEKNPFLFFTSFEDPKLIDAVRKGRKSEFQAFFENEGHDFPDPQSEDTLRRSLLSWDIRSEPSAALLRFYRELIALRKNRPAMQGITRDSLIVHPASHNTLAFERKIQTDHLYIWLHFGEQPRIIQNDTGTQLKKIFDSAGDPLPPQPIQQIIPTETPILLAPFSATVFEKN